MDKTKLKRKQRSKTMPISIRIPVTASKFMREHDYSPTAIFREALKDLGWKE